MHCLVRALGSVRYGLDSGLFCHTVPGLFECNEVSINTNQNPEYGGGVAERSNALAWKACIPKGIAGSNPVSSAMGGRK